MSRRQWRDEPRGTFSDKHMHSACQMIDKACQRAVDLFVPQRFTREQVLPWIFPADSLEKLRAVMGMVDTNAIKNYEIENNVRLQLRWGHHEDDTTPAIEASQFFPTDDAKPLMDAIHAIIDIQEQYGRVKHMLRWFNQNATPGAVRTYWPAAMTLLPDSDIADMVVPPTRYTTPEKLGEVLPLIRDTAATVAAMELLPNDVPAKDYWNMQLCFHERTKLWEGIKVHYNAAHFHI